MFLNAIRDTYYNKLYNEVCIIQIVTRNISARRIFENTKIHIPGQFLKLFHFSVRM